MSLLLDCVIKVHHVVHHPVAHVRRVVRRVRRSVGAVLTKPAVSISCVVVGGSAAVGGLGWSAWRAWEGAGASAGGAAGVQSLPLGTPLSSFAPLGPESLAQSVPLSTGLTPFHTLTDTFLLQPVVETQQVSEPGTWVIFATMLLLFSFKGWLLRLWRA